jgi:hypothetical protein
MRKFTLIILLFLGSVCNATTYYAKSTNGNDAAGDHKSPGTAMKTIAHFLTFAAESYSLVPI